MSVSTPRHGYYCANVGSILGNHAKANDLGRVMTNDSGIVTTRDPDSVRGGDVAFYSYTRLARGPLPMGYLDVVPELVFEVRSPTDRWSKILAKVGEYLAAGIVVVCVLDPDKASLAVYRADELPQVLDSEDELTLPELLGDFRVKVQTFLD